MNIKLLIVQSHVPAYTVLGKQAKDNRQLQTIVLIIDSYTHIQKVVFQEINSNIYLVHSDSKLLFISILGFTLIYTLPSTSKKELVCSTFNRILIGFELLPLESL